MKSFKTIAVFGIVFLAGLILATPIIFWAFDTLTLLLLAGVVTLLGMWFVSLLTGGAGANKAYKPLNAFSVTLYLSTPLLAVGVAFLGVMMSVGLLQIATGWDGGLAAIVFFLNPGLPMFVLSQYALLRLVGFLFRL